MKHWLIGLLLLAGRRSSRSRARLKSPSTPFRTTRNFPTGMNFGEVPGVAVNSKGHVFVFTRSNSANGPAYAPTAAQLLEFDPDRQLRARNRQGPLRLVLRALRARRQGRQHLGHRQGLGHDRQVQSRRARRYGCSAAGRNRRTTTPSLGTRHSAAARGRRAVPSAHRRRLGFAGQHLSSATATSIRASPNSTRTATG